MGVDVEAGKRRRERNAARFAARKRATLMAGHADLDHEFDLALERDNDYNVVSERSTLDECKRQSLFASRTKLTTS